MPRRKRVHYPGAIYHVIARGNNKQNIFLDDEDYKKYLYICLDCASSLSIMILAYALMPNHIHLLIEVGEIPLSKFMKLVQQRYTQYFNKKYGTVGHVFQGRYKALLVNKDRYLKQLILYIHLNPKNAGLESDLGTYRWTGHFEIVRGKRFILDIEHMLKYFDSNMSVALKNYSTLLTGTSIELSADMYVSATDEKKLSSHKSLCCLDADNYNIEELLQSVSEYFRVDPVLIIGNTKAREIVTARRIFIYIARHMLKVPCKQLAEYLNNYPEAISKVYQKVLRNEYPDLKLEESVREIIKKLTNV